MVYTILQFIIRNLWIFLCLISLVLISVSVLKWKKIQHIGKIAIFGIISLFLFLSYMHLETYSLQVQYRSFNSGFNARVVVFSDIHVGILKDQSWVKNVVNMVNSIEDIDAVFIPGDFLYQARDTDIINLLAPLSDIKAPTYTVLGNHDIDRPYTDNRNILTKFLQSNSIFLQNQITTFADRGGNLIQLAGLGDETLNEDNIDILSEIDNTQPFLVLTHSPDTLLKYADIYPTLTIVGHTHCGQIRVPPLYYYMLPVDGPFDKGFEQFNDNTVFTSCGVGEVLLPLRLFNKPTIDVIDFY